MRANCTQSAVCELFEVCDKCQVCEVSEECELYATHCAHTWPMLSLFSRRPLAAGPNSKDQRAQTSTSAPNGLATLLGATLLFLLSNSPPLSLKKLPIDQEEIPNQQTFLNSPKAARQRAATKRPLERNLIDYLHHHYCSSFAPHLLPTQLGAPSCLISYYSVQPLRFGRNC